MKIYHYTNESGINDKVQIHEKPYVCAMQIRFIIILAFRHIQREKMLFLSIVAVLLFSFTLYGIIFHYEKTSKTSLRKQLQHISFIISVDSTDLKESVKILEMSPLIDSLSIITPQQSQQFVESELGIVSDSTIRSTDFPSIVAIHPSAACRSKSDFMAITELSERLPLTDNILYNETEQFIYTELYETYTGTKTILTAFFCLISLLFAFYNAAILGKRIKTDSLIFSQSGASALFSASPWMLYYLLAIGCGLIITCAALTLGVYLKASVFNDRYLLTELPLHVQQTPFLAIVMWYFLTFLITVLLLYSGATRHSFWKARNDS